MSSRLVPRRQRGAAAVEFAIIATVFLMLLIGTMEMGRVLFYWNTATELTRMGVRIAVVCSATDSARVAARIASFYPLIPANHVQVDYVDGAGGGAVTEVTVRVTAGVPIAIYIPFVSLSLSLPEFRSTLPRESLASAVDGGANPVCN